MFPELPAAGGAVGRRLPAAPNRICSESGCARTGRNLLKFRSLTPQDCTPTTCRLAPRARNPSGYLPGVRKSAGLLSGASGTEKTPATFRVPFLCAVRSRPPVLHAGQPLLSRRRRNVAPKVSPQPPSRAPCSASPARKPDCRRRVRQEAKALVIRLRRTGGIPSLRSPVRCSLLPGIARYASDAGSLTCFSD